MPRIVLINPWVHDFSAYNLWSAPMGLYKTLEYLSAYDAELSLIDCLNAPIKPKEDGRSHIRKEKILKPHVYKSIPRYYYRFGISKEEFKIKICSLLPIDAFLITSVMSYWYPGVKETISVLKEISPRTPVILGGIYATLYNEHAANTGADIVYEGAVDNKLIAILSHNGIELHPSKAMGHWSDYLGVKTHAPILTSTGCPMRCTYCASHLLNPSFSQRPAHEVFQEINLLYEKGVRHFVFYDDALLMNPNEHIVPLLEMVLKNLSGVSFSTPVGIQARMISKRLAQLMKQTGFQYIRIGYETHDTKRQKITGGKIYDEDLVSAVANLKEVGFAAGDIGTFIMYGLPNQQFEEVKESVEFVKSLGVKIALTEFSPITGTAESEKLPAAILSEPLYANNTAFSYLFSNYNDDDVKKLKVELSNHNNSVFKV